MVEPAIKIEDLSYIYSPETAFAYQALSNINLTIQGETITAVIGHTGSGKSTLMQLVDGLLIPTNGSITVDKVKVTPNSSKEDFAQLRNHVGFVFQFPESQLFADSVIQDVMFGPLNLGMSENAARRNAKEALERLSFPTNLYERSPFELSGGQMRRVAIAGVLAMDPKILILDEPTAGLDPNGRKELMQLVQQLHEEGKTIILITHQMEQVAEYADQVVALSHGQVAFNGSPHELFDDQSRLQKIGLVAPQTVRFAQKLQEQGVHITKLPMNVDELAEEIIKVKKGMTGYGK